MQSSERDVGGSIPRRFNPLAKLAEGNVWGVLTDQIGTPTELIAQDRSVAWQGDIDGYGHVTQTARGTDCPFRWPGQMEDEDTKLLYNRFRYADPEIGGYTSRDPLGIRGGLRALTYVSKPLVSSDPLGLSDPWDTLFTQDSIGDRFLQGPWAGRTLNEAIEATHRLGVLPEGLELNIMRLNDEWVALNNRTLYVAQRANLTNVRVTDVGPRGINQLNKLLDGGMPLAPGEQPAVRKSCTR